MDTKTITHIDKRHHRNQLLLSTLIVLVIAIICIIIGISKLDTYHLPITASVISRHQCNVLVNAISTKYTCIADLIYTVNGEYYKAENLAVESHRPIIIGTIVTLYYKKSQPTHVSARASLTSSPRMLIIAGIIMGMSSIMRWI